MSFTRWRHFITAGRRNWHYPPAVLSLEQGLLIFVVVIVVVVGAAAAAAADCLVCICVLLPTISRSLSTEMEQSHG